MPAGLLDVVWIYDDFIRPPGPKMVACVEPAMGFFFRINSEPKWQEPVLITKALNPFLRWDSYLECGSPLEFDDYVIEESLRHRGFCGTLDRECLPRICAAIAGSRRIRPKDRDLIALALGCPTGTPGARSPSAPP